MTPIEVREYSRKNTKICERKKNLKKFENLGKIKKFQKISLEKSKKIIIYKHDKFETNKKIL